MISPHQNLGKFLVTPQIQEDESLRGYIARVAHRNGSFAFVRQMLDSFFIASRSIPTFSQLTGVQGAVLASLGSYSLSKESKPCKVRFGVASLPINQVWQRTRNICPRCLAKDGISKGYWDLKSYTCCHKHAVKLVSACSDCNRSFSWSSGSPETCTCGLHLSEVRAVAAPAGAEMGIYSFLAQSFSDSISCKDSVMVQTIPQKFYRLDWTLLLIEFIKFVLIPAFMNHLNWEDQSVDDRHMQNLVAQMLMDGNYRQILREAVFLHAAKDPMTMRKALLPGNRLELIQQFFKDSTEDVPFHQSLWDFQRARQLQAKRRHATKRRKAKSATQHEFGSALSIPQWDIYRVDITLDSRSSVTQVAA